MWRIPDPSLRSATGFLALLLAVAIATAILTSTGIGRQLQSAISGVAARVPV